MAGERLHDFDLYLCHHALDNVRCNLAVPGFADYVEGQLSEPVLACLRNMDDESEPPELLLNDDELDGLAAAFAGGSFEYDQPWTPYEPLYRQGLDCVTEIREALSREHAERWACVSARFAEQLQGDRVYLGTGIQVVREWVGEARRLLRTMGSVELLPAPEGHFPTPTHPEPPPCSQVEEPRPSVVPEVQISSASLEEVRTLQHEVRDLLVRQRTVKDFYSIEEVAKILGRAEFTVRQWCRNGRVNAKKQGSGRGKHQNWVISHEELQRYQRDGLLPRSRPG